MTRQRVVVALVTLVVCALAWGQMWQDFHSSPDRCVAQIGATHDADHGCMR